MSVDSEADRVQTRLSDRCHRHGRRVEQSCGLKIFDLCSSPDIENLGLGACLEIKPLSSYWSNALVSLHFETKLKYHQLT